MEKFVFQDYTSKNFENKTIKNYSQLHIDFKRQQPYAKITFRSGDRETTLDEKTIAT